jgi:hypothetical protein
MKNPKTDQKNSKSTTTANPEGRPAAASERQTIASATMIEACDRLGGKLDEMAGIVREQIEAWRQIHEPAAPNPGGIESPADPSGFVRAPVESSEAGGDRNPKGPLEGRETGPDKTAGDETGAESMTALAEGARRLADTLTQTRSGWPEQAAGIQQALEAIMAYLENQAAAAAPQVDTADIIKRLKDLEEEQENLQSQLNNNRWGP